MSRLSSRLVQMRYINIPMDMDILIMNNMVVFRVAKIKSTRALRGSLAHNLRLQDTPNADPSRRHLNIEPSTLSTIDKCLARNDEVLSGVKVRKNAVLAHEILVTGSPEHMAALTRAQQMEYFKDAQQYLNKLHGGARNLISMSVHFDETTPHCHFIYAPVIDGRLNSRLVIGGHKQRLSELQTEFAAVVGAKHGFQRGEKNSKATHQDLRDLKKLDADVKALNLEREKLSNEISNLQFELNRQEKRHQIISEKLLNPLLTALTVEVEQMPMMLKKAVDMMFEYRKEIQETVSPIVMQRIDKVVDSVVNPKNSVGHQIDRKKKAMP